MGQEQGKDAHRDTGEVVCVWLVAPCRRALYSEQMCLLHKM